MRQNVTGFAIFSLSRVMSVCVDDDEDDDECDDEDDDDVGAAECALHSCLSINLKISIVL